MLLAGRDGFTSPNCVVREAETTHHGGIIKISAIKNESCLQDLLQPVEIRAPKLLPLRDDAQSIRPVSRFVGVLGNDEVLAVAVDAPGFLGGNRVIGAHV